jgi:hypothetical protein
VAGVVVAEVEAAEVEATEAVPAGLSSARAFATHSIPIAPAKVAPLQASRNTRFIAFFPTASIIVEELGRRVNSQ